VYGNESAGLELSVLDNAGNEELEVVLVWCDHGSLN
jgi:hypothetical protein